MEESKYYTPEIEEFHIGFEFQCNELGTDNWNTEFVDDIELKNIKGLKRTINDKQVRVKYLDKKDIESLGWKVDNIKNNHLEKTFNFIIYDIKIGDVFYQATLKFKYGGLLHIVFIHPDKNKFGETTSFMGYIKNKNELKKLMKQLNIG